MKLIFELSKEHKTLPKSDILNCLKSENIDHQIINDNEDALIIDTNADKNKITRVAQRISYTFCISEFLFTCNPIQNNIKNIASKHPINKQGSIAVRYRNRSNKIDSQEIIKKLADVYSINRKVILRNPDIEIRAIIADASLIVGVKKVEIDKSQFEKRKVQYRPFFSPISLHPKLARALVNLSNINKNKTLYDPFCGTGGILIEAGLIGAKVVGSDIEEKMIKGCKENLEFYNIKQYNLFRSDIGAIKSYISKVDAVVTDLPYGKSTTTKKEKIDQLYKRAFENIYNILENNGRAVIGLSNKKMISKGEKFFNIIEKHEYREHSSLTRYFVVYQK